MNYAEEIEYVKELEEALYEHDLDLVAMQNELSKANDIIERLKNLTFEASDPTEKVLLATLEMKTRKMRDYMLGRVQAKN